MKITHLLGGHNFLFALDWITCVILFLYKWLRCPKCRNLLTSSGTFTMCTCSLSLKPTETRAQCYVSVVWYWTISAVWSIRDYAAVNLSNAMLTEYVVQLTESSYNSTAQCCIKSRSPAMLLDVSQYSINFLELVSNLMTYFTSNSLFFIARLLIYRCNRRISISRRILPHI